jgi:hypothetical protein
VPDNQQDGDEGPGTDTGDDSDAVDNGQDDSADKGDDTGVVDNGQDDQQQAPDSQQTGGDKDTGTGVDNDQQGTGGDKISDDQQRRSAISRTTSRSICPRLCPTRVLVASHRLRRSRSATRLLPLRC